VVLLTGSMVAIRDAVEQHRAIGGREDGRMLPPARRPARGKLKRFA